MEVRPTPLRSLLVSDLPIVVLAATLAFVVLFWRLGEPTFWDPDEAHYAEATREMIAASDWWAPYYNGQPFFDKPILFYQLQGAAMRVWGPTEFAARIVPALGALGLMLMTFWLGATLASRSVGIVAGLLVASNAAVFALARYAILDTVFTLFTFGGAAALAVAALDESRRRWQWVGYVAIALGVLTKGPVGLVLCGFTLAVAIAVSADARQRLLALRWVWGLALIAAIALPWFLYMYWRFGRAFVDGYLLDENIRLYASRRFGNQPGVWFYLRILMTGLLPWTPMICGRLIDDIRAVWRKERLDLLETLLWAWTAAVVGFFSFSTFKLDHYVFPAVPALSILCARSWVDLRSDPALGRHSAARIGLHMVGPLLVAIGLGVGYLLITRLNLPAGAMAVPIAVTAAGAWMTAHLNVRGGRPPRVPWTAMGAMIVTYAVLVLYVIPALEAHKVAPDLARWIAARARPDDRVAVYRLSRWPAFRFYVDRPTTYLDDNGASHAFFAAPQPFYCVMRRRAYDEFVAQGVPLQIAYEREGLSATSGRALLLQQREALGRFVVATLKANHGGR